MVMDHHLLNLTNKGGKMSMKDYAVQMVEKQLDVVKELLINNEITQAQAADKIEQIENIAEIQTDYDGSPHGYLILAEDWQALKGESHE